ncbi:MAG: hypothetical protein CMD35_00900 [Flavobacteriales bacterium]|nr:hypothetical protein [Flavobacteriales bacterium]
MKFPHWRSVHTIVFDFDGIFTDNKVWVDENGKESVRCDRSDGLALDLLRRFTKEKKWNLTCLILSTEKNPVVSSRAKKLQILCVQGNSNKAAYLKSYLAINKYDCGGLVYLGNDLNDLSAIQLAGFSVVPCDAHPLIRQQANVVLPQKGGEGFVREFVEELLCIKKLSIDEIINLF